MWLYVTHLQHSQSTYIGVYVQRSLKAPAIFLYLEMDL